MRSVLVVACLLSPCAGVLAQSQPEARAVPQTQAPVLEGVAPTKVKTLHLDAKGNNVPGPIAAPAPRAAASLAPVLPPQVLPPNVKVPLYRVEPNGTMHAPDDAATAK